MNDGRNGTVKQIICIKWGTKFGPEFVNRLHGMIARNITPPFRLYCFTDDGAGLHPDIAVRPLPEFDYQAPVNTRGKWPKSRLWGDLGDVTGVVLFLDLDVIVTGSLDDFFSFGEPDDTVVGLNPNTPLEKMGQTSVYRMRVGRLKPLQDIFRADPQANPLKTPSGKIEIYSERIASFQYADCPPHPMWLEPDEWHGNAQAGQLQVLSAHPAHRLHSQLNHTSLREQYAVAGREPLTLHPRDAQARNIADGDLVRVWNSRGQVLAGAVVTDGIRPGVICLHEGAWPDLDPQAGICKNGAVNVLTKDIPTSRLGNGCAGNTALAWLEKYDGPALTLTAFDPPANA